MDITQQYTRCIKNNLTANYLVTKQNKQQRRIINYQQIIAANRGGKELMKEKSEEGMHLMKTKKKQCKRNEDIA